MGFWRPPINAGFRPVALDDGSRIGYTPLLEPVRISTGGEGFMRTRFLLLLACVTALCFSQATLTNDSIIKMLKAGLSEDIVLSSIHSQPGKYSTGADDLIALKSAGVSDKIIAAMLPRPRVVGAAQLASEPKVPKNRDALRSLCGKATVG